MTTARINELLEEVALDCDEMQYTLDGDFLTEHNVNSTEVFELMEEVAKAVRAWVAMPPEMKIAAMMYADGQSELAKAFLFEAAKADTLKLLSEAGKKL